MKKTLLSHTTKRIILKNTTKTVIDCLFNDYGKNVSPNTVFTLEKGAKLRYILIIIGAVEIRKTVTIEVGEDANAEIIGLVLGNKQQKCLVNTVLHHKGQRSRGDIKVKIVLQDEAHVTYNGMIKIDKKAQQTRSYLDARALSLNTGVECNGRPELEIEADDVKASHSFTVGKLDEEHLFYLESRGVSKEDAKRIIVEGFLVDVLSGLEGDVQEKIQNEIARNI